MSRKKSLKIIALELLEKYAAAEEITISELSGDIAAENKALKNEVRRYKKAIKAFPDDVQNVKHGEWTHDEFDMLCCSECKEELAFEETTPYCPYCGAKMDGKEQKDEC